MRLYRLLLAVSLACVWGHDAQAQAWNLCNAAQPCHIWYGTTATNSSGQWSITIPAGTFTTTPIVSPMAISADATLANQASVQMIAPTVSNGAWTLSGTVTLPNTITVGGAPNKAAGAGITVNVVAVGY